MLDAKGSCSREVDHFLIILVDDLVKSLILPQVVKVGVFPDLVELLEPRSESSLERVQTCVYLHTIHMKGDYCPQLHPVRALDLQGRAALYRHQAPGRSSSLSTVLV